MENYNKTILDLINNETSYSIQRNSFKRQSFVDPKLNTYIGLYKSSFRRTSTLFPRKSMKFSSVVPNLNKLNLKDYDTNLKPIDSPLNLNSIKFDNSFNHIIQNKNINDLNKDKLTYKSD